jgi:hypothetical protein
MYTIGVDEDDAVRKRLEVRDPGPPQHLGRRLRLQRGEEQTLLAVMLQKPDNGAITEVTDAVEEYDRLRGRPTGRHHLVGTR